MAVDEGAATVLLAAVLYEERHNNPAAMIALMAMTAMTVGSIDATVSGPAREFGGRTQRKPQVGFRRPKDLNASERDFPDAQRSGSRV
jgi:hypothetical protein